MKGRLVVSENTKNRITPINRYFIVFNQKEGEELVKMGYKKNDLIEVGGADPDMRRAFASLLKMFRDIPDGAKVLENFYTANVPFEDQKLIWKYLQELVGNGP